MNLLTNLIRVVVVVTLFVSSFAHLGNPYKFVANVHNYGLTSYWFSTLLAAFLPLTQIVLALGLLSKFLSKGASLLAAILLSVFAFAQGLALVNGKELSCGCFGESSFDVSWYSVLFTLSLSSAALFLFAKTPDTVALQPNA